jgi:hypothetical protein
MCPLLICQVFAGVSLPTLKRAYHILGFAVFAALSALHCFTPAHHSTVSTWQAPVKERYDELCRRADRDGCFFRGKLPPPLT